MREDERAYWTIAGQANIGTLLKVKHFYAFFLPEGSQRMGFPGTVEFIHLNRISSGTFTEYDPTDAI